MKLDENSTITLKLLRIATRRLLQGIVRSCVHEPGPDTVTFVVQRRDSENHQALRSSPSLGFATLCRHCFSLKNSLIFFVNSLIRFSFVFITKITLVFSLKFIFPSKIPYFWKDASISATTICMPGRTAIKYDTLTSAYYNDDRFVSSAVTFPSLASFVFILQNSEWMKKRFPRDIRVNFPYNGKTYTLLMCCDEPMDAVVCFFETFWFLTYSLHLLT